MALQELTEYEPQLIEGPEGKQQVRQFYTTSESDIPRYGGSATGLGSFPTGYRISQVNSQREGKDSGGTAAWKVTITAGPDYLTNEDGEDPNEEDGQEVIPRFGFKVALSTGKSDKGKPYPNTSIIFWVKWKYRIEEYTTVVSNIVSKMGGINSAANDPFPGAVVNAWRLTGAPMEWLSSSVFEVEFQYTHAGRLHDGSVASWATRWPKDYGVDPLPAAWKVQIGESGFSWP